MAEKAAVTETEPTMEKMDAASAGSYVSRIQNMKEWINDRRKTVQPWGEFINNKASRPKSTGAALSRLRLNLVRFQSNYLFVCLGLAVYCVISSPMLLIALFITAIAHHFIGVRLAAQPIRVLGRDFTTNDHLMLTALIAIPLLFLSSAGSATLWIIGASVVLVSLHSLLMPTEEESSGFELDMDEEV
ncbi:prenylated Rab acceptor protein 1-like [Sycon ciliatum]|uniref:prenylated Rab acceptor protein 1-like n=1 Tax=Sycon ciliatum TaxID=27933 RepID=UPI0020AE98FC|eukprot:scpid87441/ scgid21727/ Prenylated Rab acceptor protein 1; PRA1 family protein 1; Prenylin